MLAPFVPTPAICVTAALKMLDIGKSKIFYDLGGGDGRVSFAALLDSPTICRCIENDPRLCTKIERNFKRFCRIHYNQMPGLNVSRFELLQKDILEVNISDATHIYLYLTEDAMPGIAQKLENELQTDTRIVSCEYPISDWKAIEMETVWDLTLYLYQIGKQ